MQGVRNAICDRRACRAADQKTGSKVFWRRLNASGAFSFIKKPGNEAQASGQRISAAQNSCMADLTDEIETNAANPKKVLSDGLLTEEHGLQDMIAADRYLRQQASSAATTNGQLPLQLFKFKPPGTV
jgi:hypothetical protein